MKRHLKVRAVLKNLGSASPFVEVTMVSQSHFGEDFGIEHKNYSTYGSIFFDHRVDGSIVRLYSLTEKAEISRFGDTLWVRLPGINNINPTCLCTLQDWPLIKKAIEAYNEWGETQ